MTTSYTIDAKDKSLGRLASEVAALLNAKNSIDFVKNRVADVSVKVINASQVKVTGNKMKVSVHKSFSGYPSGLKEMPLDYVVAKKGFGELIKHAVLSCCFHIVIKNYYSSMTRFFIRIS
jgi:large subunit ribosomal protein L13